VSVALLVTETGCVALVGSGRSADDPALVSVALLVTETGCVALVGSRRVMRGGTRGRKRGACPDRPAEARVTLLEAKARRVSLLGKDRPTDHGAYTVVVVADATTLVAVVDRLDISAVARELAVWTVVADAEEGVATVARRGRMPPGSDLKSAVDVVDVDDQGAVGHGGLRSGVIDVALVDAAFGGAEEEALLRRLLDVSHVLERGHDMDIVKRAVAMGRAVAHASQALRDSVSQCGLDRSWSTSRNQAVVTNHGTTTLEEVAGVIV
jgi:hypothetical protein